MPKSSARLNVVNLLNTSHVPRGPCDSPVELYSRFISRLHPPAPGSSSGNCLDQMSPCGPSQEGSWHSPCQGSHRSLGWERVNFLPGSRCGAVLWSCAGNRADNAGMFSFLLGSPCSEPRPFLLLTRPTSEGLGVHRDLGGHR